MPTLSMPANSVGRSDPSADAGTAGMGRLADQRSSSVFWDVLVRHPFRQRGHPAALALRNCQVRC